MNGHIIPGTCIAVDYWRVKGLEQHYSYFLTHFHGDHINGLTSSWKREIYCSEFTAYLLQTHHGLPTSLVKVTPLNQSIIVSTAHGQTFNVTALEANHCPGAVMFYFEGDFGKILYTGDFRFSRKMKENLGYLRGCIDVLYLDNTFCDPRCTFPPRRVCFDDMVRIVKEHPNHDILIGVRNLGKEHMLANLGIAVNESIFVSSKSLLMSQVLFDTDVFTTAALSKRRGRIRTHPMREINKWLLRDLQEYKPTIAIIPSAICSGLGRKSSFSGEHIFVVPYSDHSSYPELMQFVSMLAPAKVLPIVSCSRLFGSDTSNRSDMSCFDKCLRTVPVPCSTSQVTETYKTLAPWVSSEHSSESQVNLASVFTSGKSSQEFCTLSDRPPLKRKKNTSMMKERAKKIPRGITYDEDDCIQEEQNETLSREKKETSIATKTKYQKSEPEQMNLGACDSDSDENQRHELINVSSEDDCQENDLVSSRLFPFSEHVSAREDCGARTLQASTNTLKDQSCGNIVSTCGSGFQRTWDQNKGHTGETSSGQSIAVSEITVFRKLPEESKGTDPESSNKAVYSQKNSCKKCVCLKQNESFYRAPLEDISRSAKCLNVESSIDNVCAIEICNECDAKSVSDSAQHRPTSQTCKEVNKVEMAFGSDLMIDTARSSSESNCREQSNYSNVPHHKKEKSFSKYITSPYFKGDIAGNEESRVSALCNKKAQVYSTSTEQSKPRTFTGNAWFQNTFTEKPSVSRAPKSFLYSPSVEVKEKVATSSSNILSNVEQTNVVSASDRSTCSSKSSPLSECANPRPTEKTEEHVQTKLLSRERLKAVSELSEIQFSHYCKSLTTSIFISDKDRHLEILRKLHLFRLMNGSSSPSFQCHV